MSLEMYVTCRAIISLPSSTATGIEGRRTSDFSEDTFGDPNDSAWEPVFLVMSHRGVGVAEGDSPRIRQ
jgi:hypothetical protein